MKSNHGNDVAISLETNTKVIGDYVVIKTGKKEKYYILDKRGNFNEIDIKTLVMREKKIITTDIKNIIGNSKSNYEQYLKGRVKLLKNIEGFKNKKPIIKEKIKEKPIKFTDMFE